MSFIRTFQGDIEPDALGYTYSHEHIVCRPPYWVKQEADDLLLDDKEKSKLDVLDFKNLGGQSIVDATAIDYGRDVLAVKEIAEETGVTILGTAGFNKSFCGMPRFQNSLSQSLAITKPFTNGLMRNRLMNWLTL